MSDGPVQGVCHTNWRFTNNLILINLMLIRLIFDNNAQPLVYRTPKGA
jgi:hypothetical protein